MAESESGEGGHPSGAFIAGDTNSDAVYAKAEKALTMMKETLAKLEANDELDDGGETKQEGDTVGENVEESYVHSGTILMLHQFTDPVIDMASWSKNAREDYDKIECVEDLYKFANKYKGHIDESKFPSCENFGQITLANLLEVVQKHGCYGRRTKNGIDSLSFRTALKSSRAEGFVLDELGETEETATKTEEKGETVKNQKAEEKEESSMETTDPAEETTTQHEKKRTPDELKKENLDNRSSSEPSLEITKRQKSVACSPFSQHDQ